MAPKQELLRSEVIIERYGKALSGKTGKSSCQSTLCPSSLIPTRGNISVLIAGVSGGSLAGELALQLSNASPAQLILSARSESRVAPIVEKIRAAHPEVATRFLKMDLGDLSDVRRAAESLSAIPKIDHLLAVAGIMAPPYSKTVDGPESQFGVNYLANFLLVKLLLPKIRAAGTSSSIVIMASSAVRTGKVDFDDIGFNV
jgi:NAD(P)-dependent dehydrogenase (short-subunit alcohol dehydrogenase family)